MRTHRPRQRTLPEHVDGVAGGKVGAGDKVFTGGRLHLNPRPPLEVTVKTTHLTGWECDVGYTALAAVPNGTKMRVQISSVCTLTAFPISNANIFTERVCRL